MVKSKTLHYKKSQKHLLIILPLAIIGLLLLSNYLSQSKSQISNNAQGLDCSGSQESSDNSVGTDPCDQQAKPCGWNCARQASCCDLIAQGADPYVCCFEARRWCRPEQCAGMKAIADKGRCGQIWDLGLCSLPAASTPSPTPQPIFNPSPTPIILPPTQSPTTTVPSSIPTLETPTAIPTQQQVITPTPSPKRSFEIPTQAPLVIKPSNTPAPTSKPILTEIVRNTASFLQKATDFIQKFLGTILP